MLQKHLTKLKRQERHAFWNLLGSQAIQGITQRIDRSYKAFFRGLKTKRHVSSPGF